MRALGSLLFAGFSWGTLAAALLVPLTFAAPPEALVVASAFVVGMQSAQSAFVQVAPRWKASLFLWLGACACASILAGLIGAVNAPFFVAILATGAGALIGVPIGAQALEVLDQFGGLAFQKFQAGRSIATFLAIVVLSILWRFGSGWATIAMLLVLAALSTAGKLLSLVRYGPDERNGEPLEDARDPRDTSAVALLLLGLGASLVYRNDVTWLRASLANSSEFYTWHLALVGYTAIQGVIGFIVVQRFLAHREALRPQFLTFLLRWKWHGLLVWPFVSAVALLVSLHLSVVAAVCVAALLASLVGVLSGVAHVLALNWVPYIAGLLGTASLLIFLRLGVDPRLALMANNAVIGIVIWIGLTANRRSAWT